MKPTLELGPATSTPCSDTVPSLGTIEAGDHIQERALAAARRADDRDEFVCVDFEREIADGGEGRRAGGAPRKAAGDILQLQYVGAVCRHCLALPG